MDGTERRRLTPRSFRVVFTFLNVAAQNGDARTAGLRLIWNIKQSGCVHARTDKVERVNRAFRDGLGLNNTMEHQMIKNIQLSTAVFATALLGGVLLAPMVASAHPAERTTKAEPARQVRLAAAAPKEVEGTKADAREDRAEAKADRKADKADAKADRAEAKMMRHHEAEGTKADIAEDKMEAKAKK